MLGYGGVPDGVKVGVAPREEDLYAVAAAGVALGVEWLVDVAYEVDDELGGVSSRKGRWRGGGGVTLAAIARW